MLSPLCSTESKHAVCGGVIIAVSSGPWGGTGEKESS